MRAKDFLTDFTTGSNWSWPTESCLIWKWLLRELCFMHSYTIDNKQWTFFPMKIRWYFTNVTTCFDLLQFTWPRRPNIYKYGEATQEHTLEWAVFLLLLKSYARPSLIIPAAGTWNFSFFPLKSNMNYLALCWSRWVFALSFPPQFPYCISLSLSELWMLLLASTQQSKMHVFLTELPISLKSYSEILLRVTVPSCTTNNV